MTKLNPRQKKRLENYLSSSRGNDELLFDVRGLNPSIDKKLSKSGSYWKSPKKMGGLRKWLEGLLK